MDGMWTWERGIKSLEFFVDVINEWPLRALADLDLHEIKLFKIGFVCAATRKATFHDIPVFSWLPTLNRSSTFE